MSKYEGKRISQAQLNGEVTLNTVVSHIHGNCSEIGTMRCLDRPIDMAELNPRLDCTRICITWDPLCSGYRPTLCTLTTFTTLVHSTMDKII